MKSYILVCFALGICGFAHANAIPVGSEVNLDPHAVNKTYEYSYDSEWSWDLSIDSAPRLNNLQLSNQSYTWTLIQPGKNSYLVGWKPFDPKYQDHMEISLKDPVEIVSALQAGTDLSVVIADSSGKAAYFFSVGKFCSAYPHSVIDVSNPGATACKPNVSPVTKTACEEFRDSLISYVNKGLLTCKMAETSYTKGSDAFGAHDCGQYKFCPGN